MGQCTVSRVHSRSIKSLSMCYFLNQVRLRLLSARKEVGLLAPAEVGRVYNNKCSAHQFLL